MVDHQFDADGRRPVAEPVAQGLAAFQHRAERRQRRQERAGQGHDEQPISQPAAGLRRRGQGRVLGHPALAD
ncbi:hypothetical protein RZS08_40350, partial [Arthrospira platensis SPKY1]|nr:hypothetical protein [Arthrospira platensis SPKY1]